MNEAFKDFTEWLKALKDASREAVIIVEGKNDEKALRKFSIRNVLTLSGKRFADIPDMLEGKWNKVILLIDLDPKGEKIHQKLKELLREQGFEVDENFRNFLKKLNIIYIEELDEGKNAKTPNS
ncbi:toprim domain-containing protein [Aquifex pyrophilus]